MCPYLLVNLCQCWWSSLRHLARAQQGNSVEALMVMEALMVVETLMVVER